MGAGWAGPERREQEGGDDGLHVCLPSQNYGSGSGELVADSVEVDVCRYGPLEAEAKVRVARKERQKANVKESEKTKPLDVSHSYKMTRTNPRRRADLFRAPS